MRVDLIDFEEEFSHLLPVTTPNYKRRFKFHEDGLFSEQIFGPVESFRCQCGRYQGKEYSGTVCENCKVMVANSNLRLTSFARIPIPEQYTCLLHPILLDMLSSMMEGKLEGLKIIDLVTGDKSAIITENGIEVLDKRDERGNVGPVYFQRDLYPYLLDHYEEVQDFEEKYGQYLFIKSIPVIPPDTRPLSQGANKRTMYADPINTNYSVILRTLSTMTAGPLAADTLSAKLQKQVNDLFSVLLSKFGGKSGFLRSHILGKRIDYSGRAVITVDGGSLPLGWCKLPYNIAKEIYKPSIIRPLARKKQISLLKAVNDYDNEDMKPAILDVIKEKFIGTYVLLNRQPTLHRPSIQAMRVYDVIEEDVIVIHPLVCSPYNADFDGDQMAVYVPNMIGKQEAVEKMGIDRNSRLPSNGDVSFKFTQDMVLGLHRITIPMGEPIEYLETTTYPKRKELFETVVPTEYRSKESFALFNNTLNNKLISKLVDSLNKYVPTEDWVKCVDKLCRIGFKNSSSSISVLDFYIEDKENFSEETAPINDATDMIRSGARGSWDQYKQVAVTKGFVSDVTGRIVPHEIKHSLLEGLDPEEYFTSCFGGRKGLIDTAENTARSGYLTRKLVYLLMSCFMDTTVSDCHAELGNTKYLKLYVKDEGKAKSLIKRWTDQGLITKDNYLDLVGKTINLRSPLACTATGICRKCYGELYEAHKSKLIGIIAAQSLGERTTQLTLRTKHLSGSTEDTLGELKQFIQFKDGILYAKQPGSVSIEDNLVVFTFDDMEYGFEGYETFKISQRVVDGGEVCDFNEGDEIAKITMRTSDIVSAVNELSTLLSSPPKDKTIQEYMFDIMDIYGAYASIDMVHFELIMATLCRDIVDITKPYRQSETQDAVKIMGMTQMIAMMAEQAVAFERFQYFIKKILKEGSYRQLQDSNFSILKTLLFFDFDENEVPELNHDEEAQV